MLCGTYIIICNRISSTQKWKCLQWWLYSSSKARNYTSNWLILAALLAAVLHMLPVHVWRAVAAIAIEDAWQQTREMLFAELHWRRHAVHQKLTSTSHSSPRIHVYMTRSRGCLCELRISRCSKTQPIKNKSVQTNAKQFCMSKLVLNKKCSTEKVKIMLRTQCSNKWATIVACPPQRSCIFMHIYPDQAVVTHEPLWWPIHDKGKHNVGFHTKGTFVRFV